MFFYVAMFAFFAIAAIRSGISQQTPSRMWFVAVAVGLTLLIGLRNEVGGDWWNYLQIYSQIGWGSLEQAFKYTDPSFAIINWLGTQAGLGIWFPNIVCATIFVWGLIAFCRQQPNPALAFAVAIYLIVLVGMGYTRQSAALGFVFLGITEYNRGAIKRMALFLVLAVSFHTSAIIVAAIMAVVLARRGLGTLLMVLVLGAWLTYQFSSGLLVLVTRYTDTTFTAAGAIPRLLMNLIPALIFLTFPRRLAPNPVEARLWSLVSLLVFLSVFLLFFVESSTIVDRLGLYLSPLQIFVLSRVPTIFGTKSRQNLLMLSAILAYSLTIEVGWLRYGTWGHAWLPYRNYLWDAGTGKIPPRWYRRAQSI